MKKFIGVLLLVLLPLLLQPQIVSPPERAEVVIVGGGAAGIAAAWYLRDRGVVVLEKENQVGGRARNTKHGPFQVALGTEYLGPPEGAWEELLEAAGLEAFQIPSRMDVYWQPSGRNKSERGFWWGNEGLGALHQKLWNSRQLAAWIQNVRILSREIEERDPYQPLSSTLAALDKITAREWMVQQGLPQALVERWNVTARGLFGVGLETLSALSWMSELAFDVAESDWDEEELENSLESARRTPSKAYGLPLGIAQLPLTLAEKLGPNIVYTGYTVTALQGRPGDWTVVYRSTNGGNERRIRARAVILAVPAPIALSLGGNFLNLDQRNWFRNHAHAPFVVVALLSQEPIWNRAFDLAWREGSLITDIYDATWIQRQAMPQLKDDPHNAVTVYLAPTGSQDTRLRGSDSEIQSYIRQELEALWPGVWSKVQNFIIQRHEFGYPVFGPGKLSQLSRFWNNNKGSLVVVGDSTLYPTFEAALESAKMGAAEVRDFLE